MAKPEIDDVHIVCSRPTMEVQQGRITCVKRSEMGVKWIANIYQRYAVVALPPVGSTLDNTGKRKAALIISLTVIAKTAQEAMDKADEWLSGSSFENAYVSDVYRGGILELDASPLSE